jgi:glutaminyl-tRNA synthetase
MTDIPYIPPDSERQVNPNFITEVIDADLRSGRHSKIVTRFPPEPNGYAHLGHTFASWLNHSIARDYGGEFRLRMDDTNPEAERLEFAQALIEDMKWLGWDWGPEVSYASDYFDELYQMALRLIKKGLAYVDSVSPAEMARLRGSVDQPGVPSPYRERSVEENLQLFERMRSGEFKNGEQVLRAKIDLSSPNMKLRDPVLYRIVHAAHYRTGKQWCIYPSYDYAQATADALDGVTHSLCSLEFIDNRAIYDWLMDHLWEDIRVADSATHRLQGSRPHQYLQGSRPHQYLQGSRPHQYEFGRRSLEYTVVSKRKLRKLVEGNYVSGWDDPRMPTLAGQRRRGVTPEAIRGFASQISVSRTNRTVDLALLENAIRDDLNHRAPRVMAVIRPLKLILSNLETELTLSMPYWPHDVIAESTDGLVALPDGRRVKPEEAVRPVPLSPAIYIEQDDFAVDPAPGFKRLVPDGTVRLRGAGIIRCDSYSTNDAGQISELHCTLMPEATKAKGVIHWVSASKGIKAEFRLYDRLFRVPHPEAEAKELEEEDSEIQEDRDFLSFVNSHSLETVHGYVEPSLALDPPARRYQFERLGYFWPDPIDSSADALVFNRIISLKDSWSTKEVSEKEAKSKSVETQFRGEVPNAANQTKLATKSSPSDSQPQSLTPIEQTRLNSLSAQGIGHGEALVLAREGKLEAYLAESAKYGDAASLASWVVNDLGPSIREGSNRVTPAALAALVKLLQSGEINGRIAKDVLAQAQASGEAPAEIVRRKGLKQVSDSSALEPILDRLMAENADKVAAYRAGKTGLASFFVGQMMRQTKGQANPQVVQRLVEDKLG